MSVKSLIESMVKAIVEHTDKVQITEQETDKGTLFEVQVAKEDVGKLIGKEGRVASSLRTVARTAGIKSGKKVLLNVVNTGV